jgi:D-alanine transaminase
MKVYLNGSYIDAKDAMISVEDRGFFFADGIYEVVRVYEG